MNKSKSWKLRINKENAQVVSNLTLKAKKELELGGNQLRVKAGSNGNS